MIDIVIGTGYGDCGKGMVVDWYTRRRILPSGGYPPIVVRFNGGHQCGHRVKHKDKEHIFSSFGSGTLRGATTYWSRECTIDPIAFMNEYNVLQKIGVTPHIYASPECPITTPYDVINNRISEKVYQHGSTGSGFGSTISRNEGTDKLKLVELRNKYMLDHKLEKFFRGEELERKVYLDFIRAIRDMIDVIIVLPEDKFFHRQSPLESEQARKNYIFEGNQGILLDHEYGFFPHVTRSNTMSRGAKRIVELIGEIPEVTYVTRAYGTRHGNGPFPGEQWKDHLSLTNTEGEANAKHEWQGEFRTAPIDLEMLQYAMMIDDYTRGFPIQDTNLIVTCCDHIDPDHLPVVENKAFRWETKEIFNRFSENTIFTDSPTWSSEI